MVNASASGFQEFEDRWLQATGDLARSEEGLCEAMQACRRQQSDFRPARLSQALTARRQAKDAVDSLMHTIWRQII